MIHQLDQSYAETFPSITGHQSNFRWLIVRWSWIALILAVLYQCFFHIDIVNMVAIFCVALGWAIATRIFLRGSVFTDFPLSSFLVMGFASTQLFLPLLFTTLEGRSLIYNLELPEEVFLHSISCLMVITVAHAVYRFLSRMNLSTPYPLLTKAGFFIPPSDLQLWLFGLIGLASTYYSYFFSPEIGRAATEGTSIDKVIQALVPFSYAPFLMPLGKLFGRAGKLGPNIIPLLLVYAVALFALSIGRNSRGGFMVGLTVVAFAYGLGLLLGVYRTRIFTIRNAAIGAGLFWLLTGPMADLGTAMVIVRGEREQIPAAELIDLTLEAFQDKRAIQERRQEDNLNIGDTGWDERYLDNVFTARFANIKYNDMSLICASNTGVQDPDMFAYSLDFIAYNLPEPVLKTFNLDVDKEFIGSFSFGDYLFEAAGGNQGYEGGFKTGHLAGTGMSAFGWWYLLILGVGMIPMYFLFDVFYIKKRSPDSNEVTNLQFSFCGLLALSSIWSFLPGESVVELATFLLRGWVQRVVLYFAIFQITRFLVGVIRVRLKWGS